MPLLVLGTINNAHSLYQTACTLTLHNAHPLDLMSSSPLQVLGMIDNPHYLYRMTVLVAIASLAPAVPHDCLCHNMLPVMVACARDKVRDACPQAVESASAGAKLMVMRTLPCIVLQPCQNSFCKGSFPRHFQHLSGAVCTHLCCMKYAGFPWCSLA